MSERRSTIGDVANLAGVSIATVSRVLNDGSSSKETQKKVLDAAELLGYAPDARTREQGTASSRQRVGILLSHKDSYTEGVLDAIITSLSDLKYDVLICSTVGREGNETKYLSELAHSNVDALITMSADQLKYLPGVDAVRIPHVIISGDAGESQMTSVIRTDDSRGMAEAYAHLRSLGHERIAHITGDLRQISAQVRSETYRELMANDGFETGDLIVEGDYRPAGGRRGAEKLLGLDDPPTAIITGNDNEMLGVLEFAKERDIHVPGELSLVSFDDIPEMANSVPAITTVAQALDEVGTTAAQEIHERITEKRSPTTITVPMQLIIRDSTGPVPAT